MKKLILYNFLILMTLASYGQYFELPQISGDVFTGTKVRVGVDFALQYQVLNHQADSMLIPLGTGFNLPAANFNLEADLAKGMQVGLTTYLSSRHHNEAWVKGGYLLVDELPFIRSEGIDRLMDLLTIKVGVMELDYGDAHYRRTDNGSALSNPFIGNYIMDAFTTAPALEIMLRSNGWLAMGALTTGNLRQDLVRYSNGNYYTYDSHREIGFYWKAGYDKSFTDDIRLRCTVSGYHIPKNSHSSTLYGGDRTGSRYYLIMNRVTGSPTDTDIKSNHLSGNWSPGTATKNNSSMVNLFGKVKWLEVFGTYELARGKYSNGDAFRFSQIGAEGLLRFGGRQQFYTGFRYNIVEGSKNTGTETGKSVNRLQFGAGWFLIESTVLKIEYVSQHYKDFIAEYGEEAGFKGVMIEAAISF